jgi:hypothetical protein
MVAPAARSRAGVNGSSRAPHHLVGSPPPFSLQRPVVLRRALDKGRGEDGGRFALVLVERLTRIDADEAT